MASVVRKNGESGDAASGPPDDSLFVSGQAADAENGLHPNTCSICTRELVQSGLAYKSLDYYLIRCSPGKKHVYHTKCFLNGLNECMLCQEERKQHIYDFLFRFVNDLLDSSSDHVNYGTKQHLFQFWNSHDRSRISNDIDVQGYEMDELVLLRTKIGDLGNIDQSSNLLTVIQSKIRIMHICGLSNDDFCAYLAAESTPHVPEEILDIRLPDGVLRGFDLPRLLKIVRSMVFFRDRYTCETRRRYVSRIMTVIGLNGDFVLTPDVLYDLLASFVENDQAGLIKYMYENLNVALRMEHNRALEIAILYVQRCAFDAVSFKYLCMCVLENTALTGAQIAEFLGVFRNERGSGSAAGRQDDLSGVGWIASGLTPGCKMELDRCFRCSAPAEGTEAAMHDAAFSALLTSPDDFKFNYKLLPREFWTEEKDHMLLQSVIRSENDENVASCLAYISEREYYGTGSFLRIFNTIAQSRLRCHIFTLINITKEGVFGALQDEGKIAELVCRLVNLGLYWCILYMERHIEDERRFKQLLDEHFSSIMAFYYHDTRPTEYSPQFFISPIRLYARHTETMKYDTELTFNYRYFADYLKCLARTGVSKRKIEFIIKEMCRNQRHMVHVTKEDVCAVSSFFIDCKYGILYLGAFLGSCCSSDLKNCMRLEMVRALVPATGERYGAMDLRDFERILANSADKLQCLSSKTRDFLDDMARSKDFMLSLSKIDGRQLMRLFKNRRCRNGGLWG